MSLIINIKYWLPYYGFLFISIITICCVAICSKKEPVRHANHEHNDSDDEDLDIDNFSLESVNSQQLSYHLNNQNTITNQTEQRLRQLRRLYGSRRIYEIRRQRVLDSIIIKKVIQSTDHSTTTTSSDLENQIPSPEQPQPPPQSQLQQALDDTNESSHNDIDLCNSSSRVFHSFVSALVKSNKSVAFSSSTEHNHDIHDTHNHNPNNDKSIHNTHKSKPTTRRKSNTVARRISLSLQTFGTESEPVGCNICLMEFQVGEHVAWSNNPDCIHGYHMECIVDWLLVKNECPICRRDYLYRK